jgi:hypothetical protein
MILTKNGRLSFVVEKQVAFITGLEIEMLINNLERAVARSFQKFIKSLTI